MPIGQVQLRWYYSAPRNVVQQLHYNALAYNRRPGTLVEDATEEQVRQKNTQADDNEASWMPVNRANMDHRGAMKKQKIVHQARLQEAQLRRHFADIQATAEEEARIRAEEARITQQSQRRPQQPAVGSPSVALGSLFGNLSIDTPVSRAAAAQMAAAAMVAWYRPG